MSRVDRRRSRADTVGVQDDGNATPRYEFGKMDILILIVFLVVLGLFSQVVGGNSRDLDAKLGA